MASSSSNSAQAYYSRSWTYDVFLSFRGEDTRKTFVDHLYSDLAKTPIRVYKDDEALLMGDSIGPSLLKSIEESKIAVIVFSENYADSSWCLDELLYIMKCREERGLIVMPVFYGVDPSDVRKQENKFGKAFARQEAKNTTKANLWRKAFGKQEAKDTTKVESWRKALVDASNIAGWEPNNISSGHESKVIKEIVDTIQDRLLFSSSDVDEDEELVGMKSRLQDLKSRLEIGAGGVRMVGIWGIGGCGKTTLATSVYNEVFRHFQGSCMVANIREESNKHGIKFLQQKVLSTVLKTEVVVQSVEEGKGIINSRLRNRKVLVLLDDVDDLDQLQALAGSHKWFGSGSRIIITTRDEHLLRSHKVDHVYPVRLLSDQEAFQLFYKHAYNERDPISDYKTLSSLVVSYAAGLPLALKVLGSFLFDKDENEWISALFKLKDIPNLKVTDILKISYGLEAYQKKLLFENLCFFRQQRTNLKDEAMEIHDACGFHPIIGIKALRKKAPITTVGPYIVMGERPNNPEKHTRVWKDEEIRNLSFGDTAKENHKIEAIKYDGHLSPLNISNMMKPTWLVRYNDNSAERPNILSNESSFFDWMGYPASALPESFQPMNLTQKLDNRLPKELWKGYKIMVYLKFLKLDLSFMKNLPSTLYFDGLCCLRTLILNGCGKLEGIPLSFQNVTCLQTLILNGCGKFEGIPLSLENNPCLQTPILNGCGKLGGIPLSLENNPCLQTLILSGCDKLEKIPLSLQNCRSLDYISLLYCDKLIVFPKIVLTEHLLRSQRVDRRLIRTYKDHEAIVRGYSIGPSLLKDIEESQIAVIVFSKNYADSSWFLDVLAYIMKCRDEIGLIVIPLFYDVDPSQVRKPEGIFGEAFAKQEAKHLTEVEKWRKALVKASNIAGWKPKHIAKQEAKDATKAELWRKALFHASNAGWEPKHIANRHEKKAIKEIFDKIQDRLFPLDSDVDEDLECLQDLISKLEIGRGGVRMVGIRGISGSDRKIGTFDFCIKPKKKLRVAACDRRTNMLEKVMKAETLETFLEALGLGKYSLIFRSEEYDMMSLLHVTERDLVRLGIPVGPGGSILQALKIKYKA